MVSTRRLAAILAADVAGYSRLMGADKERTPAIACASVSTAGSSFNASAIRPSVATSSRTSAASAASSSVPCARPRLIASAARTASWQVKALVEATPVSLRYLLANARAIGLPPLDASRS